MTVSVCVAMHRLCCAVVSLAQLFMFGDCTSLLLQLTTQTPVRHNGYFQTNKKHEKRARYERRRDARCVSFFVRFFQSIFTSALVKLGCCFFSLNVEKGIFTDFSGFSFDGNMSLQNRKSSEQKRLCSDVFLSIQGVNRKTSKNIPIPNIQKHPKTSLTSLAFKNIANIQIHCQNPKSSPTSKTSRTIKKHRKTSPTSKNIANIQKHRQHP